MTPHQKQYGLWPSPIAPASLAQSLRLSDVAWDTDSETLVWLEGRSGQGVLVCSQAGQAPRDLTPTCSVRARVGYGGGDFSVSGGWVYYVAQEGRIYRQPLDPALGPAQPVTPQFGHMASPTPSPDGKWLLFVHTYEGQDCLAIVDTAGTMWPQRLVHGEDFYMQPCWHPDRSDGSVARIAWVSWNHPNMPWDGTRLNIATLHIDSTSLPQVANIQTLVDEPDVSVFQPQFSPDGASLAYISDVTGWNNLYLYDLKSGSTQALTNEAVDIGIPAWAQGRRTYGFSPDGNKTYVCRNEAGFSRFATLDVDKADYAENHQENKLAGYTSLGQIAVSPLSGQVAFLASSSTVGGRVISYNPGSDAVHIYKRATSESVPTEALATPQPVSWPAPDGTLVHGLYYPPTSTQYTGSGLPPAIINIHGGPTGQSNASYNSRAQYFSTRGYAYLEINYRGSTGYGKTYMAALRGKWGILDVEDAVGGAQYLVDAKLANPDKLVIMGGSAGGYTVLKSLVDHPGFFKAALCLYGVSNMFTLASDTHKFEERYLDSMLGPLPQASDIYRQRSPIFNADKISDPIAVFQGEIDRVVPKAQAETIVASLRQRGVPHEYYVYEGEGHGWRKQETIETFYNTVDRFLRQYVIFS